LERDLYYVYVGLVGISGLDVYAWTEKYITDHYGPLRTYPEVRIVRTSHLTICKGLIIKTIIRTKYEFTRCLLSAEVIL
jgi:hypothetical protein